MRQGVRNQFHSDEHDLEGVPFTISLFFILANGGKINDLNILFLNNSKGV